MSNQQFPQQPQNPQQPHDPQQHPQQPQFPGQQPPPYPGAAPAAVAKPKKPWFKKWWVWVVALVLIIGFGNAIGGAGQSGTAGDPPASQTVETGADTTPVEPAKEAPKEKLALEEGWEIDKSNQFAVYINGYVVNNTDKAITNYVQITFDALDAAGANLGTCLANTNTIDANGKWRFKAMCTSDAKEIAEIRFKEITGF